MKIKFFASLVLIICMIVPGFSQEKETYEGNESTFKNDYFYNVKTYSHKFKSKKPKNVIVMIGDGMGVAHVFAGATANQGKLNLNNFKHVGFSRTQSANRYITDSGAGGTAIATGNKAINYSVGLNAEGNPVPSILKVAQQNGLSTGIVVTTSILDATPADFVAHVPQRDMSSEIAAQFAESNVDVFIGGGMRHFNNREDNRNLLEELKQKGYQVLDDIDAIKNVKSGKLAGFVRNGRLSQRGDQLQVTTDVALDILDNNRKGFFLMIEGSEIDGGGHENDMAFLVEDMLDFDRAVGKVLDFAEKDGRTLVIVTADHETGGLTLVDGNMQTGEVTGRFSSDGHTAVMVPVFAYGPGAEMFSGINENTSFFAKIKSLMRFK